MVPSRFRTRLPRAAAITAMVVALGTPVGSASATAIPAATVDGSAPDRSPSVAESRGGGHGQAWSGSWATAPQWPMPSNEWLGPNWSMDGFGGQSVRQVVRLSTGGSHLRIRLSNLYGTMPLRVTGATIAKTGVGAAIRPGTMLPLTFGHAPHATIPPGQTLNSDAVPLSAAPLERLTVTLYFAEPTGPATFHQGGLTTTYRAVGDHRFDNGAEAYAGGTSHSWYYLTGVDVAGGPQAARGAVVAFGDSITDGAISTPDADNRYPDELAERLVAAGKPIGVLNAGINGNMVLTDSPCFAGDKGVGRFTRDALDQPGVRAAIVLEGINDIVPSGDIGCGAPPLLTAEQIIEGHRELIRAAHARKIKIIGATLTPIKGNDLYYSVQNEAVRDEVNQWIRSGGEYDAVVDLDRVLADPEDSDAMRPAYAAEDKLHPNDAGMRAMASAINLRIL
ncbi:SGNH/GDSL hydrolase family protein [Sphaerisporangium flaviroseum]|uniref:SGNH/GDSL hydrolase family protein n=1 Tax=Sphaerisporangium flaviroseum TaxID=509199 RepID=A0ABP7I5F9_9ACTN